MGLIHIDLFTTLDGVAQAPGGPEEDTEGGFAFGGWQAPLLDDVVGQQVGEGMEGLDALLLGRSTYDIFAAYWPHQEEGVDNEIARLFNGVPKYVASRGHPTLDWADSRLLGADRRRGRARAARPPRPRARDRQPRPRPDAARPKLFDRLSLWVYPIVLGTGSRSSPMAPCRRTSPSSNRRSPLLAAPSSCGTHAPMAPRRRVT